MRAPPIRVVIVESTPHLRALARSVIASTPRLELVGEAESGLEAVDLVTKVKPDLVLLDIESQGLDGLTATRLISDRLPDARVIAWTNNDAPEFVTAMIAAGAFGYLLKGTPAREFAESMKWAADGQSVLSRDLTSAVMQELGRLYRHAEDRANELRDSYLSTVESLVIALETKDDVTGTHARRVQDYATIITRHYDESLLANEALVFGFLLHDVGKIGIPDRILMKPGPLDEEEWEVMRKHPGMGTRILDTASFLQPDAIQVVGHHHERWDGKGYPSKLAKEEIPIGARLFAIADTFDAMTSDRPYRTRMDPDLASAEIVRCSGTQFDPALVETFVQAEGEIRTRMTKDQVGATV